MEEKPVRPPRPPREVSVNRSDRCLPTPPGSVAGSASARAGGSVGRTRSALPTPPVAARSGGPPPRPAARSGLGGASRAPTRAPGVGAPRRGLGGAHLSQLVEFKPLKNEPLLFDPEGPASPEPVAVVTLLPRNSTLSAVDAPSNPNGPSKSGLSNTSVENFSASSPAPVSPRGPPMRATDRVLQNHTMHPSTSAAAAGGSGSSSSPMSHRDHVVDEIIHTERYYVQNLTVLSQRLIVPLRQAARAEAAAGADASGPLRPREGSQSGSSGSLSSRTRRARAVLSEDQINTLFSNLPQILGVNRILLQDLEERFRDWRPLDSRIGDVFGQIGPYLKEYIVYARNHEAAMELLEELEAKPAFQTFLRAWESSPDCDGLSLNSFLILPIQRIPRYELFLKDLVKHTEPAHPDYDSLVRALDEIRKVNVTVDDKLRENENRFKLFKVQQSLSKGTFGGELPQLIEPHRLLLKEGALSKVCRSRVEVRYFFLFNDLLLYASQSSISGKKYVYHNMFALDKLQVQDEPDSRDVQNAFKLINPTKSFVVIASGEPAKRDWLKVLESAIYDWREKKKSLGLGEDEAVDNAPVWVRNEDANNCMLCKKNFTLTFRKHHCRRCGMLVCNDCSQQRMLLQHVSDKPVRVCDPCFRGDDSSLLASSPPVRESSSFGVSSFGGRSTLKQPNS